MPAFSRLGVGAVLAGATGIGFAPILVRWSEVGPSATAAFRLLFALPVLWLLVLWERKRNPVAAQPSTRHEFMMLAVAGLFFTADLSIWHWSLQFTSVANSTLLTNFAPIFVTVGARVLFHERISPSFVAGMLTAVVGAALLVAPRAHVGAQHVLGDALAIAGAIFYAGYLLTIKFLRTKLSTQAIMAWSGLVSCPSFFAIAALSGEKLVLVDARGWGVVLALALISHAGGQSLIAYALGHLPASFSAVSLLWQPVMAALLAWAALNEPLTLLQGGGGLLVLAGIAIASQTSAGAVRPRVLAS